MEALFRSFDIDQSGYIDFTEWETGIKAIALVKNFHAHTNDIKALFE